MPRHAAAQKKASRHRRPAARPAHARKPARAKKRMVHETPAAVPAAKGESKEPRLVGFVEIDVVPATESAAEFEQEPVAQTPENSFVMEEEEY